MSFYTALTGLNGAQADISATSNNIANVGTTGFKRSRAEFGDIFATSPLQNASSSIGSGTILKGIKQQFTQGNIASSLNALDLAISGQGFFALQPSLTSSQTVYTRNGSFNVDNDRYVVDSAGQYLMTYPVNTDGSVTAKDLDSAVPLQLPVTSGDPKATSNIQLGVNVPADAPVITTQEQFADGYAFNPDDASTYTNSTSITIFDDLGNPTIATIYFIKTQTASADDPTNKYDTRLVINDTIIDPNLVSAVDDAGTQIFIDRFGNQTTQVPDDNYFLEGKGSPLYKLDDLNKQVDSQPARITGAQSAFDFGEEGDKLVEIVTDPLRFSATREGGNDDGDLFWGKDFLLINVDDADAPVSIDLRPGKYNAEQLASEVERAINQAYGDDKKIQLYQNVDDTLTIDFMKLNTTDGTTEGLAAPVRIDLLKPSYVTEFSKIEVEDSSPDFTSDEFLSHVQERINQGLDDYAQGQTNASNLGVDGRMFAIAKGEKIVSLPSQADFFQLTRNYTEEIPDEEGAELSFIDAGTSLDLANLSLIEGETYTISIGEEQASYVLKSGDSVDSLVAAWNTAYQDNGVDITVTVLDGSISAVDSEDNALSEFSVERDEGVQAQSFNETHYLTYSYYGSEPSIDMFNKKVSLNKDDISYNASQNTLTILIDEFTYSSSNIRLIGSAATSHLDGRDLRILEKNYDDNGDANGIRIDTTGLGLPSNLNELLAAGEINLFYEPSQEVEAYFEGAEPSAEGVYETFDSSKIVLREIGASKIRKSAFETNTFAFNFETSNLTTETQRTALKALGLETFKDNNSATTGKSEFGWVDRRNPPVKVTYDNINQRLAFSVDRTVLGTGTNSNFSSFSISGAADAEGTNGIGIPTANMAENIEIRGGEILYADSFIADGDEIQLNDKRYGVKVDYNSDTKNFSISSGTTGEKIDADGALGVDTAQKASNIQIGRRKLVDGAIDTSETITLDSQIIGSGTNLLFGFDANSNDFLYEQGTGLAAAEAVAVGRAAQSDLTEVFRLNSTNGENVFNVSVNGINGIIEIPAGNYVGTTLATALEQRINQIADPDTGEVVGGVKVRYSTQDNNFTFTTGTTGSDSTIKVKGTARLGLADVPLGVGSVPKIFNLVQATNADGVALYVDASGNVVTSPPENLVEGYYPLYIDEGELTFDKTGRLVSPRNNVSYEQQAEGFSISLDIDYSASTQFAQPFSVLSVEQDGFTSGRLDGLEIDSSGTIRANYTNGQNTPLGKIVVANFNNQNGLKQIGNATYVETAVSGTPQVGEAGSEGFGNILAGSLERSNVDITEELVNLITAQRNYQASAKAIETTTSLTQTIINIRM